MSGENIPLAATAAAVLCSEVLRLPPAMPPPPPASDDGGSDGEAGLGLMIRPRVSRPEDGLDFKGKKVEMGQSGALMLTETDGNTNHFPEKYSVFHPLVCHVS